MHGKNEPFFFPSNGGPWLWFSSHGTWSETSWRLSHPSPKKNVRQLCIGSILLKSGRRGEHKEHTQIKQHDMMEPPGGPSYKNSKLQFPMKKCKPSCAWCFYPAQHAWVPLYENHLPRLPAFCWPMGATSMLPRHSCKPNFSGATTLILDMVHLKFYAPGKGKSCCKHNHFQVPCSNLGVFYGAVWNHHLHPQKLMAGTPWQVCVVRAPYFPNLWILWQRDCNLLNCLTFLLEEKASTSKDGLNSPLEALRTGDIIGVFTNLGCLHRPL